MQGCSNNRWEDMFGQKFDHWNACHRLIPNLFLRNNTDIKNSKKLLINTCPISNKSWKQIRGTDWPETWNDFGKQELPEIIQQEIESRLSLQTVQVTNDEYNFFSNNLFAYKKAICHTEKLKDDGFLVSGIPLKLQSLTEKKQIIKNFNECVTWYNQWVNKNNFGKHYSESELDLLAHNEELKLNSPVQQQLGYANSKLLSS